MLQLSYKEMCEIQVLLEEKYSHRKIAKVLWRHHSTISDEIKKYSVNWRYIAEIAFIQRNTKRALINSLIHCRIPRWSKLDKYIKEKLKLHWSPEQIAWRWKKEHLEEKLGIKTIYTFIKRVYPELAKELFRRKMKPYKYWTIQAKYIYDRVSIHERPEKVNKYEEFGHREADTMWWTWYKWWFVTLTERKSKMELARIVYSKESVIVTEELGKMIESVPKELVKSITFDNGTEFVNHFELKAKYGIKTYFCDPWDPWQRWLNEYTNGLLREFAPKKCKWLKFKQEDVDKMVRLLNMRPRKKLDYDTPIEYLAKNWIKI